MNKIAINQTYPAQGTIDELEPLKTLDWKRFEKLCLRLAEKEFNVTDIRDYLKQGNNQEGIDIYASLPDNEEVSTELKYLTIQCKRVKKYSPLKLAEAVNNFVSCDWFKVSSKFILATTHDLGTQKIEEEIKKQRDKLHKLDKEFEIWDYRRLNTRLKCYPQIVYDFFDGREPNWVKAFCGEIHLKSIIFSEVVTKKRYKNNTPFYIERKLYKEAKAQKEIFSSLDFKSKEYTSFKDELLTSRISANPIRILLLSVAGRGKSVEMEYLAHLACKKEYNLFPVLINLRNYTGDSITDILQIHFKGWDKIPQQELLLIFDGLDEPAEDQRQNFAGKISDFIMLSSQANIVISTRDNFITKDTNNKAVDFKLFDLYYLKDFDDRDIEEYLLKKFSNDKTKTNDFLSHVKDKSFYGELVSPFYLKYLSDVYKDTPNSFPNSIEDLFDLIITAKANTNIEKYSRSGVSFEMQLEHHNKLVSIVSISMEQLGRNFINEIELQKIIPDLKDRKLIQYSFLFNKSRKDSKSWEFEHNNFQEYLAAKTIANLDIEKIINLISVYPKKNKIKPKWLNTVAYLFSIVEKDSDKFKVLFDWIADNEPEVITRFEPDRFTKSKREDIFKKIFLKYKDSDMWIGNASTTNAEHLISFSGYSKNNISFLLNEIEDGASRGLNITVDALNMLYRFETLHGFDNKIKGLLLSVIYNKKVESFIRNWALTCINNLKLLNKSDIDALIIKCPDVEKIDTRNQLYKSLRKVGKVDEHLDFLIEGIKILEIENKKHNSIGRGYQLQKTILKLNEINSIIKIVNHVFSLDYFDREILSEYTYKKNFGSLLIERLSEKYNDAPNEIFKSLVEILYKLERRYEEKYRDDLRAFFDTTENNLKGFKALVKKEFTNGENSLNINWSFSIIADTTCVDWFIKEYKRNKISDQAIQNFRFYLSQKGREGLHDYLQSKLTSLNEAKWKYAERIDWEKLKEKQMARNFELLLNKNDFEKAVMEVFDKIGKEELVERFS